MKIEGQAALVTGGASGLGEATARELARRGAKVAVLDRNGELAAKVASEIGGIACACDITDTASMSAVPSMKPKAGESTIATAVLMKPLAIRFSIPPFAIAPPARPPINAWEELDGMPKYQVITFQLIPPTSAPKIT